MDPQAVEPTSWLVQTKLQPPLPRNDVISRPRLLAALRDGLDTHRLTLLSAPAGYGKTTLLSSSRLHAADNLPIANRKSSIENRMVWLALDEGDNDPVLFLAYLTTALQRLEPACGATAQTMLNSLPDPGAQVRRIAGVLINDILETLPDPFVLVLDDLHLITEPAVHVTLDYLLEHAPPSMRLVIATRQDPPLSLARLRARGQLVELRTPDFHFILAETMVFLNDRLDLALSTEDLNILQARTEGWPVGLRLLAGSLARIPTAAARSAFITELAQTDRYVFDFLADEVLNLQPPNVQTFLLETSVLSELIPSLCNTVTNRTDAEHILDDLDRRSLFVVAVNSDRTAYRYHTLFAEFLRQRLAREMPERVPELHRRAAEAIVQAEDVHNRQALAIEHYLAAEMWAPAARVIEQAGEELYQRGLLNTLIGWIHALPVHVRDAHPQLIWDLGICILLKGEAHAAQPLLGQALQDLETAGDDAGQGEILAQMATGAMMDGDLARAGALVHRAMAHPTPHSNLVQLLMLRAWLGFFQGDWARAEADFAAALAVTEEADDPLVWLMLAFNLHVQLALLPGGLERIERFCRRARAYVQDPISPIQLAIEEEMTFVHLQRGRLDEAIQAGERALAIKEQLGGFPFLGLDAAAYLAVIHAARGNYADADHYFDFLFDQMGEVALYQRTMSAQLYRLGRARWLQRRYKEARQVYARMCGAQSDTELPQVPVFRLMMHALLELTERRYAQAQSSLHQAIHLEQELQLPFLMCSARLLLAHLHLKLGRPQDALAKLKPMLIQCEQDGTPGLILQQGTLVVPLLRLAVEQDVLASFAVHLLDLLGATSELCTIQVPETGEILTPREVEVLRLVVAGASNPAIAEQLVITVRTVKAHVSSILRKLDVSSRIQAAARIRELFPSGF